MAGQLRCLCRHLQHSAALRQATRGIHASVLLTPSIAFKGQSLSAPAKNLKNASSAEELLQEAEGRLRTQLEEAEKLRLEQQVKDTSAPTREAEILLRQLRDQLLSDDAETQLSGAERIRRILSETEEAAATMDCVLSCDIVRPLVQLLVPSAVPALQLEAAWALTNIASGSNDHVREVVAHGAVPLLLQLLKSPDDNVREQAVWTLGNIAGDCEEMRDLVISGGAVSAVCELLQKPFDDSSTVARTAAWLLTNCCRGSPPPIRDLLEPAFPVWEGLLRSDDEEIVEQACWAFAYLTKSEVYVPTVVDSLLCQKFVDLLQHQEDKVLIPALRVLGNIAAAKDADTRAVVECGVLAALASLLAHPSRKLRQSACWILSNIFVGCPEQVQVAIDSKIVESLLPLLQSGPLEVRKEAVWSLANMIMHGESHHIVHLVECGCVASIVESLHLFDDATNLRLLAVTERILCIGKEQQEESHTKGNPFAMLVRQANVLGKIETFLSHSDEDVRDTSSRVLACL